jgi:phosphoribosylaminoimidazolecarboxamide formyltransferase / IMP cyclohydrolase
MKKIALLSVSNKEGIVEFAQGLQLLGYKILSTGGTAALLKKNNISVQEVADYTGHAEILDGRVKTLHPKIFGGILGDISDLSHQKQMEVFGIEPISLVCVNLYPFLETIMKKAPLDETLENIDVGGPTMIRAAAKNYKNVIVAINPKDYVRILDALNAGEVSNEFKSELALKAFAHTARYDTIINRFFVEKFGTESFPGFYNFTFEKVQDLRYGENPHQKAALYKPFFMNETGIANAKQLQGKELSYNNILDSTEALAIVEDFEKPTCAVIKHTNPSGVASAHSISEAFTHAHAADPKSAFGSVIALNKECDAVTADLMKDLFIEVIIAPSFHAGALDVFSKKKNLRLLETGPFKVDRSSPEMRSIAAGLLVQSRQFPTLTEEDMKVVTTRKPTKKEIEDMIFAWKVNKNVKSNAVVFAKNECTVGIGAGQMSRVDAVNLVRMKQESKTNGSVMSSDAYFPFRDGLDQAVAAGATAIIQPGGSIRDQEVIDAANEHGIAMVFTGIRLFKH